jgi:hypothetical protein
MTSTTSLDTVSSVHASIWKFLGNPDELIGRYDAMVREIPTDGPELRALRERHGLPEPERIDDFPVHAVFVDGRLALARPRAS